MADLSVFSRVKTKMDFDRENEEFQLRKEAAKADIAKTRQLDVDKLGEVAFMKAAQGLDLTPQERAAAQYVDAKSGGIQFDPVNGGMIQKPRISDKIGIPGIQPAQAQPSFGGFGNASPQMDTPQAATYNDPVEANYKAQMQAAAGNRKLQQDLTAAYQKSRIESTEAELKAAGFSDRMKESAPLIDKYSDVGRDLKQKAMGALPLVGNYLVSDEYQMLDQAKRDFINAQLRRESGAVINPDEFANAEKQYFPQPGDSEAVLKQKAINRATAASGMERSAGPSYASPQGVVSDEAFDGMNIQPLTVQDLERDPMAASRNAVMQRNAQGIQNPNQTLPQPTGQPAPPKKGQAINGYMFMGGDPSKQSNWKKVK